MPEHLRGTDEGEPRLLVPAQHGDGDVGGRRTAAPHLLVLERVADRRRGDRADGIGTQLAGHADLGRDHARDLVDLVRRDAAVVAQALAEAGERALGEDLAQLAVTGLSATSNRVVFDPMSMQAQSKTVSLA